MEFTGELLDASVRRRTAALFQCKVANQYGANEVNSIAYECPCGNMHILETNVYAEIIKDGTAVEGEMGEICVTSLTNTAMPLIRYMIGDVGQLKRIHCACGNTAPVLEQLYGRDCQWIVDEKHNKITPYIFVRVFNIINKLFDEVIIQYQVRQKTYTMFAIKLFLEENEFPLNIIEQEIVRRLRDELTYDCQFEFEYSNTIFEGQTEGKHSFFMALKYLY